MVRYDPIIVVGLGGVGSHLVEPLARYLAAAMPEATLRLVDGDAYALSNLSRQRVSQAHVGGNKAEVQAALLRAAIERIKVAARPEYVHAGNVRDLIVEGACVFSCVDNHASRRLLSDALKRLKNGLLISGGNELYDGNVQVHLRSQGKDRTSPIEKFHPEIEFPRDDNPADLSCEELARLPSHPQVIFTNLAAAALMLNAFHQAVNGGGVPYDEVCFDIRTNRAAAIAR